ncbi:hypothetical protein ACFQ2H_08160 [Streptomyces violaceoruber]
MVVGEQDADLRGGGRRGAPYADVVDAGVGVVGVVDAPAWRPRADGSDGSGRDGSDMVGATSWEGVR